MFSLHLGVWFVLFICTALMFLLAVWVLFLIHSLSLAWPLSGRVSSFAYNSRHLPWSCADGERKCTWPGLHGFLRIPITPLQTVHIFSPFLLVLFMLRQARKFHMPLRSSEQPILGWTLNNPVQGIQEPGIPELSWSFAIVRTKAWHLLALPHEV